MVPESWIKERRRRTPTGMGVIIDVEGEMKKSGVAKPIDSIRFTISPARVGDRAAFKVHRRAVFSNGSIGGGNEGPFASVADAVRSCRTWLHLNVVTAKREPAKSQLIERGAYYRGGGGDSHRKVVYVVGDMVHWCDFAGPGACGSRAFASWMKERIEEPSVEVVRRIEAAIQTHGRDEEGYEFADRLLRSVEASMEMDEGAAHSGPR